MLNHILLLTRAKPQAIRRAPHPAVALVALASIALVACESTCPPGRVLQGNLCHIVSPDAGDTDAAIESGPLNAAGAGGTGMVTNAATAAGTGSKTKPSIDPAIEWMCMKNAAGECTSCKQDGDCPRRVCEQGYCMDCRDASQCDAANSRISNRCVPERKPSSVWQVSGGGQTSAAGLKLQLSIGMPTPVTEAAVGGFKMDGALGAGNF